MSNTKKAETLGMPHGTAVHRLRKNILFSLLQKHGENICFKCAEIIETAAELSIEHKLPWEGRSADLFWDLENIAFSHLRCNTPHRFGNGNTKALLQNLYHTKTKDAPAGFAWCSGHKAYREIGLFHLNVRNVNHVASYCKECRKEKTDTLQF
jgi:hypothetical protein